jgi:aerobic-type carbon monoxide dehydrogenase small subunit (CoxS/CutS family)
MNPDRSDSTNAVTSVRSFKRAKAIELTVNGRNVQVEEGRHRVLLQVLREELQLIGTKFGCGEGQCGACTVLIDGRAVRSCITPVATAREKKVTTIEGLAKGDTLSRVQQAFLDENAMQCGYCVPGMIMSTTALLERFPNPSTEQLRDGMNGNICRCNNFLKIEAAIHRAAGLEREGQ